MTWKFLPHVGIFRNFSGGSFKDYVVCVFFPNFLLENDVLSAGFELQLSTNDLSAPLSRTKKLASFWGPYPRRFLQVEKILPFGGSNDP